MRKIIVLALFLGIQVLFISCLKDTDNPIEEPLLKEILMDVPDGSSSQQKFDLHLTAGREVEKTKVIVLVHGGGWIGEDKSDMEYITSINKDQHPKHAIMNYCWRTYIINVCLAIRPRKTSEVYC